MILGILLLSHFLPSKADAQDEEQSYNVRVIYLKPLDVDETPHEEIARIMSGTQQLYQDGMVENGRGEKTFQLERLVNGNVKVNVVRGNHKAAHYSFNVWSNVMDEIPADLQGTKNVHIIIIGKLKKFGADVVPGGVHGFGFSYFGGLRCSDNYGGIAFIAENAEPSLNWSVAHFLGHAFGMYHNLDEMQGTIMGKKDHEGFRITEYESQWLDKHHYFNEDRVFNCAPEPVRFIPIQIIDKDHVSFSLQVKDEDGLHMAKLVRVSDIATIAVDYLAGEEDFIQFKVNRHGLQDDMNEAGIGEIILEIMDDLGNFRETTHAFSLPEVPEELLVPEEVEEPLSVIDGVKISTWGRIKTQ